MSDKIKKITRLIDEMSTMLLSSDFTSLDVKIIPGDDELKICFYHYGNSMNANRLEEIEEILNKPRRFELETYYWTLVGEADIDHSLNLVGSLIDYATVERNDNDVSITVIRKN